MTHTKPRMALYALLFLALTGFTLVNVGLVRSEPLVGAVTAAHNDNPGAAAFVSVTDETFLGKVLHFMNKERVCALTADQATMLAAAYDVSTETVSVDGEDVFVLFVYGSPLNKNMLEETLGSELAPDQCQIVQSNKVVALLTPVFVS